jgi:hypothetical protein
VLALSPLVRRAQTIRAVALRPGEIADDSCDAAGTLRARESPVST